MKRILSTSKSVSTVFVVLCLTFGTQSIQAESPFVPGRLLVKPKTGVPEAVIQSTLRGHSAKQVGAIPAIDVRILNVPEHTFDTVLRALQHNPNFEFAEPDFRAEALLVPNDPYYGYGYEWHLPKISAPQAWDLTTGSVSVTIGLVDTGVSFSHPDLAGKILSGYDFGDGDSDPSDTAGHGTSVAGTAAALSNNGVGVTGPAWACPILPVKVFPSGNQGASYSAVANGITYAADHGARIINLSLGSTTASSTLQSAVDYAWGKNCVIVAAAGNNGTSDPVYPGACQNVLAVSALRSDDTLASWSSYGSFVSLCAPGDSIWTTILDPATLYGYVSGTSFASPIVAGVAALVASANPQLSNAQIVDVLKQNADDLGTAGYDIYFGYGKVNAYKAVLAARGTVAGPDNTAPTVAITSPTTGASVAGTVTVNVNASDNIGVSRIECYLDGQLGGSSSGASTAFSWDTTAWTNGSHTLQAKAFDAAGNASSSSPVTVSVQNVAAASDMTPPAVQIASPVSGSTATKNLKVSVKASDNIGVVRVDLFLDGALYTSSTSATPVFSLNTSKWSRGTHTLEARASDAAGNMATSAPCYVKK